MISYRNLNLLSKLCNKIKLRRCCKLENHAFTWNYAILVYDILPVSKKLSIKVIVVTGILGFVGLCTWSDYYYSKLEGDYIVLTDFQNIGGFVTDLRVHWNYAYLTINSTDRILICPSGTSIMRQRNLANSLKLVI